MRWHQLWRTLIESKGSVITITAKEHEGRQHKIILQREELAELVAWLREGADELEKAHGILDQAEVPRSLPGADVEEVIDQGERS